MFIVTASTSSVSILTGDRHPSNLMLNRGTGKVLHIDFGDCFEVACHRDKFPGKFLSTNSFSRLVILLIYNRKSSFPIDAYAGECYGSVWH